LAPQCPPPTFFILESPLSGTQAPQAYPESSFYDLYWKTWVCFIYLCHHPRSHLTKSL